MTLDLHTVKEDFALMVQKVQPWTLSQFVMWLDLKVAEYKVHGYMILDYEGHLNQLFSTEPKKPPPKNGPFTTAATAPMRTAPSRNIAKQTSVINIDADSPPPPPTAPAQNQTAHLRNTHTQVIDIDLAQPLPSNSRNIQALYTRNSQPVENDLSVPTLSPPISGYSLSKNTANVSANQYATHNGQHTMNSNGLRTSLTHPRAFNSNQSQLVNGDNTIIVSGSRGNSVMSYSQQPTVTRGYVSGEQAYQNQPSVQHINVDPEPENDLNLVQVEPQIELLMDVECENDYVPESWNSSAALSSGAIKEKRLLQSSVDIKNGNFSSAVTETKPANNINNLEMLNEPVPEIKLEDVKHCTDAESFVLNTENSNSCNRSLNMEDCLQINDSDSDIECDNPQESLQDSLTDHVWSSEDSAREPPNLPQSVSKRRYLSHRIKPIISLPSFNGYLQNMLESGKAQFVWSKLVEQCAYHILAQKDIREKHDYREFCHALYQRYPSIGLEGPQPWSHFSKTLSQKIRHIRWQHKKRSTLGEGQKNAPPGVSASTTTTSTATSTTTTINTNTAIPSNLSAAASLGNNSLIVTTTNDMKEDAGCETTHMVQKCEEV